MTCYKLNTFLRFNLDKKFEDGYWMKFNYDAPFWKRMEKLYYIIVLNFVWLLFSLPIVTIGSSTAALYKTMFSLIRGEEIHAFKSFFQAFKHKFLKNTFVGIILIGFSFVLIWGHGFYLQLANNISNIFYYIYIFVVFLFIMFMIYIFPVIVVYDKNLMDSIRLSIFLSIKYLPFSFIMAVINFFIIYLCQFIIPLALIAVAVIVFIDFNIIVHKVLKRESTN